MTTSNASRAGHATLPLHRVAPDLDSDPDPEPDATPDAEPGVAPPTASAPRSQRAPSSRSASRPGSPTTSGPAPRRRPRRGQSPFRVLRTESLLAAAYVVATATWAIGGGALPGGRWLAVHLFTLGVVTNLIVPFTRHFGETLTRQPGDPRTWPAVVLNAGIVALLAGIATGTTWALGVGATVVTVEVTRNWYDLRRRRKRALGARFSWIVRIYERAHGAFIHGAVLGALLGLGVFKGDWYGSARLAHLHINVLGWGGLTLLSTLVFFGPTVLRVRIEPGADARAARWLRWGATALSVAVVALLVTAVGGVAGTGLRVVAGAGLGVLAIAAAATCLPILRVARGSRRSYSGSLLRAACAWLPMTIAADAVVVAFGAWRLLDAVGIALLFGVLAQAIVGSLTYVAPLLPGGDAAHREAVRDRVEAAPEIRIATTNAAVAALVAAVAVGPAAGAAGGYVVRFAGALLIITLVAQVVLALARPVVAE